MPSFVETDLGSPILPKGQYGQSYPFNVKYASPLPETKHTTLSLAFHWKFQNANMCPNLFNVKYASPLPPPRKAISGPSLIAAGSLGKEGGEKNVRQFRTG